MHRIKIEQDRRKVTRIWIDGKEQKNVVSYYIRQEGHEAIDFCIEDHFHRQSSRHRILPIATLIITVSGAPIP